MLQSITTLQITKLAKWIFRSPVLWEDLINCLPGQISSQNKSRDQFQPAGTLSLRCLRSWWTLIATTRQWKLNCDAINSQPMSKSFLLSLGPSFRWVFSSVTSNFLTENIFSTSLELLFVYHRSVYHFFMKLFLLLIFSITNLRMLETTAHFYLPFGWVLRKASQFSTNIISKPMSLLCTVLPWVCPPLIFQVLTDYSLVFNPKYKLSYFHAKKWPEEWIDGALSVLWEHWVNNYKPFNTQEATTKSACCIVWCNMNSNLCLWLHMITHLQH